MAPSFFVGVEKSLRKDHKSKACQGERCKVTLVETRLDY